LKIDLIITVTLLTDEENFIWHRAQVTDLDLINLWSFKDTRWFVSVAHRLLLHPTPVSKVSRQGVQGHVTAAAGVREGTVYRRGGEWDPDIPVHFTTTPRDDVYGSGMFWEIQTR